MDGILSEGGKVEESPSAGGVLVEKKKCGEMYCDL
jgi:hypothetical protein